MTKLINDLLNSLIEAEEERLLSRDEALNLAAWIVALTDSAHEEFNRKLAEVEHTCEIEPGESHD